MSLNIDRQKMSLMPNPRTLSVFSLSQQLASLLADSMFRTPLKPLSQTVQNFFLQNNLSFELTEIQEWLTQINWQLNTRLESNWQEILSENRVISPNDYRKAEIAFIQRKLRHLGYTIRDGNGKYRGLFGKQTLNAIQHFQKVMRRKPNGILDRDSLILLINTEPIRLPDGLHQKDSAILYGLHPKIQATFPLIVEAWKKQAAPYPVITSGNDSKHQNNSKHYSNRAIDLRGNNISKSTLKKIAMELQNTLGRNYRVIPEFSPKNPSNDHIHLQYEGD